MTLTRTIQIQNFLRQRAEWRNEEFGSALTWFVAEGLALRLGKSIVREQVLLRGDLMLHAVLADEAPYEWEAELLVKHPMTLAILAKNIREVCDVDIDDGLQLELPTNGISESMRTAEGEEIPVVLIGTLGTMRIPLQIKVFNDAIGCHKHADFRFQSMLGRASDARVTTCSPHMAIAEAIRLIVAGGVASIYPKRIWNLYQLIQSGKFEEAQVVSCIKEAFGDRQRRLSDETPFALSNEFAAHHSRKEGWEIFVRRTRIQAPPLTDVIAVLRSVVSPWLKKATI